MMERTYVPTCMLKLVLHSQRVANPEELVWSQREGGKRKRRLRTKLQLPSLVGHLEPSVVRNVFSLQVVWINYRGFSPVWVFHRQAGCSIPWWWSCCTAQSCIGSSQGIWNLGSDWVPYWKPYLSSDSASHQSSRFPSELKFLPKLSKPWVISCPTMSPSVA